MKNSQKKRGNLTPDDSQLLIGTLDRFMKTVTLYMTDTEYEVAQVDEESFLEAQLFFLDQGIDYRREIDPIFRDWITQFVVLRGVAKGAVRAWQEHLKWVKRYEGPLRVLTEQGAPLSEELKARLRETLSILRMINYQDVVLSATRSYRGSIGQPILAENVSKASQKHPFWQTLAWKLFTIITAKGVPATKARALIANLFRCLPSDWYDVKYPEDSIRLNAKYRRAAKA